MATRSDAAHAARIWEKAAGPDPDDNAGLALAYAYVGRRDQAMQRIAHAEARAPWDRDALSAANVRETAARVFMVLGDTSSAISRIDELLGRPGGLAVEIVEHDPRWDSLRDLAEFQKMLDRHR